MKYAFFIGSLALSFFLVNPTAMAQNDSKQLRIIDILDGFGPNQYSLSSVEFGHPDKIVDWAKGDTGVASLTHKDINGNDVKDAHIYIYKEGKNADNKTIHDKGAHGGAKVIQDAQINSGVNCVSDEKPFETEYVKVKNDDVVCIKTRSGDKYVLAKILEVGANGIKLRVYAGPQTKSYFPAVDNGVPVKVSSYEKRGASR